MPDARQKYPYRAFVCYAHNDGEIAASVETALTKCGLVVLLDKKLSWGFDYSLEIQNFIECAHLFIPIITKGSLKQPWVNQEIGFAHALNVPVLPICVGVDPKGMIQNRQAILVNDIASLEQRLADKDFEQVVTPAAKANRILVEIAASAIRRPELMAQYGAKVRDEGRTFGGGMVRQRAYYTSFSIPDEPLDAPIWAEREYGQQRRTTDYLEAQRRERQVMEQLANVWGCRLIIDPRRERFDGDAVGWHARLKVLRDFIATATVKTLEVIPEDLPEPYNVVLVGDRFSAEADSRLAGEGYLRTQFTWHAPTVFRRVDSFESKFADLCRSRGVDPKESRHYTLDVLNKLLA